MNGRKRYKLIACEIMFREICYCAARCNHIIDITFMSKGLHDIGASKMVSKLQLEIERVDITKYEAVLLGYGLCNNGVQGLHSDLPMVIPRAHDCITLLMGSKEKYQDYFEKNPDTFFKSTGWVERDINPNEVEDSITSQLGMNESYQEYLSKYGEENARYLIETMGNWQKNYHKLAYIDTNIGDFTKYKMLTKEQAEIKGWEYEEVQGDVSLLLKLLNGDWDSKDFLTIPANKFIQTSYDERIINFR